MATAAPLQLPKDEQGSPLQSPSDVQDEADQEILPNVENSGDNLIDNNNSPKLANPDKSTSYDLNTKTNELKENTNDTKEEQQENTPNTDITQQDSISIDDIENIPNHKRENVISSTKIVPIVDTINNEIQQKSQLNDTNHEEQKQDPNTMKAKQIEIKVEHGHCSKQGIRPTMEDQVVVEATFIVANSKCTSGYMSLYAVFDGHGGNQCAEFCAANLQDILSSYLLKSEDVATAFASAISELDTKVIEYAKDASGSTCCIILIDNRTYDLWCCNVGDSRCILINESYSNVKQLSIEHKPEYPLEKQRIEAANGWVTYGRVCGILAVSRSLGDKDFKYEIENLIISTPDVTHHKLVLNEDKYVILACDGLYDVFTNEQCVQWLCQNTTNDHDDIVQEVTDRMCHDAIHVRKTKDNVSIIIIRIDGHEIEVDITENGGNQQNVENEENDFDGQEIEEKEDKIYNSTSSNGSGSSAISSTAENDMNESLQSIQSNESQTDANNDHIKPQKHKFHVVVASDDGIADNINVNDLDMADDEDGDNDE